MAGLTLSILASPPGSHLTQAAKSSSGSASRRWYQIGSATWYGKEFAGKRTANGDRFNPEALTCAHRTLPLGSWVKVTNLRNSKSAFLRVNDRGPYVPSTIIDLSFAAARKLGLGGRSPVKLEAVRADDPELSRQIVSSLPSASPIERSLLNR